MHTTAAPTMLDDVKKTVELTLKIPADKLDIDAEFESFGMDSIIAMELMSNLSRKFAIAITPAQFTELNTVRELATFVGSKVSNAAAVVKPDTKAAPSPVLAPAPAAPVQKAPVALTQATRSAQAERRSPHSFRARTPSFEKLVTFIRQHYAIDLGSRSFSSLDDIVETLAYNHLDELLYHYGLAGESAVADALDNTDTMDLSFLDYPVQPAPQPTSDIAIVGMSCRFPDAPNPQTFWDNLIAQKNSIQEIPASRWDWTQHYAESTTPRKTVSKWGALLNDVECFDPHFFNLTPEEAHLMDPQERLLLQEVYKAFQDACIDVQQLSGTNTGVFVGYEYTEYEQYLRKNIKDIDDSLVFSSSSQTYYLANRLSYIFDFCGPSESINTNCASTAVAINRAYYSLLNNESSVAVVGGVSLHLFADDYIALSQFGMLSPDGTCSVFDDNANGFTRGEGVAAIVLKRLDDAERDNNRIYGVIKSCHQNNRGKANSISEIKHDSITRALTDCYEKAAVDPTTVNYIEVDGYSTKWGDSFEFEGIKNVFMGAVGTSGTTEKYCALGSVKGNIGHLEPVSGIASVIKLALSMYHKQFPATITAKNISNFIDINNPEHPLYIAAAAIPFDRIRNAAQPIRAGVNSFADSGANVHILLEEYLPKTAVADATEKDITAGPHLFTLSAKTHASLMDSVNTYILFLLSADVPFTQMAYSLQVGRESLNERLAIMASSQQELIGKLQLVQKTAQEKLSGLESRGIYAGSEHAKQPAVMNLITADMIAQQVATCRTTQQWQPLAMLWVSGAAIPWKKIWVNSAIQPVSLPTYCFDKSKYWVSINGATHFNADVRNETSVKIPTEPVVKTIFESQAKTRWKFYKKSASDNVESINAIASMIAVAKIELFLKQDIALQLQKNVDEISTENHYFELGMTSLGIANLIQNTNNLLSIYLSPSVVFDYATIQKFSTYLAEKYPDKVNDVVVEAQPEEPISEKITQLNIKNVLENSKDILFEVNKIASQGIALDQPVIGGVDIAIENVLEKISLNADADMSNYEKITF